MRARCARVLFACALFARAMAPATAVLTVVGESAVPTTTLPAAPSTTPVPAPEQHFVLDCCRVLAELYTYMGQTAQYRCPADGVDANCHKVPLFRHFNASTTAAIEGSRSHVQGSQMHVYYPADSKLEHLLVLALFGRSASSASVSTKSEYWVRFDEKHGKVVFEQTACEYNKSVYSLLILSSISLLMFFIAVNVVNGVEMKQKMAELEKRNSETQPLMHDQLLMKGMKEVDNKTFGAQNSMSAPLSTLMRVNRW